MNPQDRPLVSIVVAAYNAEPYLADTLASLVAQTYRPIEIIVVDDGSTDTTAEIAKRFEPSVACIHQDNSGGCSVPRNTGIRSSTGAFVTVFDADDIMCPDKIATQVTFLETTPAAGCVLMDYVNFDAEGAWAHSHFDTCPLFRQHLSTAGCEGTALLTSDVAKRLLLLENFSVAGSPLFRRAALDTAGLYDPSLRASEDFELQYRVSSRYPTGVVSQVGFQHRVHGHNMSADAPRMIESRLRSREKLLAGETDPACRALLNDVLSALYLEKGRRLAGCHNRDALVATLTSLRYRRSSVRAVARNLTKVALSTVHASR